MKKQVSFTVFFLFLLALFFLPLSYFSIRSVAYDVDGNGDIEIYDLILIKNHLLKKSSLSSFQLKRILGSTNKLDIDVTDLLVAKEKAMEHQNDLNRYSLFKSLESEKDFINFYKLDDADFEVSFQMFVDNYDFIPDDFVYTWDGEPEDYFFWNLCGEMRDDGITGSISYDEAMTYYNQKYGE